MTPSRSSKPPGPRDGRGPSREVSISSALTRLDSEPLHPRLEALLQRVHAAEQTAVGEHRRPTFKLMRELLGACVHLGVPAQHLAECLGTSRGAVLARANSADGKLTPDLIRQLTDLTPRQLDHLSKRELAGGDRADQELYPTVDVIRALLNTPRPKARRATGG